MLFCVLPAYLVLQCWVVSIFAVGGWGWGRVQEFVVCGRRKTLYYCRAHGGGGGGDADRLVVQPRNIYLVRWYS